ncbi:hypothetical protein SARU107417_00095 [Salinibacter ruber]
MGRFFSKPPIGIYLFNSALLAHDSHDLLELSLKDQPGLQWNVGAIWDSQLAATIGRKIAFYKIWSEMPFSSANRHRGLCLRPYLAK